MPSSDDHRDIERLLARHEKLIAENNRLLKKLHKFHLVSAWLKVVWIALIVGLPFAFYFYILEPYFSAFGASYQQFEVGIHEIPGLKWIEHFTGTSTDRQ